MCDWYMAVSAVMDDSDAESIAAMCRKECRDIIEDAMYEGERGQRVSSLVGGGPLWRDIFFTCPDFLSSILNIIYL